MFLYFVRHGESEANLIHEFSNRGWKHGLTQLGISQVQSLADNLGDIRVRRIYSSTLMRGVQTAEILALKFHVEVEVTDALREFDTGVNEGRTDAQSWELWRTVMDEWMRLKRYDSRIPGGESFNDMRQRFFPFIERIRSEYTDPSDCLLLIGHGGLFYCMLPLLLNLVDFAEVESLEFPNTAYVLAESTSAGLVCREWCGKPI